MANAPGGPGQGREPLGATRASYRPRLPGTLTLSQDVCWARHEVAPQHLPRPRATLSAYAEHASVAGPGQVAPAPPTDAGPPTWGAVVFGEQDDLVPKGKKGTEPQRHSSEP